MKPNIQIGKTYNAFDDGKVKESRRYEVIIKEIIPFNDIDMDTFKIWNNESKECDWLYAETTDYFIIADNGEEENNGKEVFVRTKDGGWFSMGFLNSGRLDVDGSLTQRSNEYLKEYEESLKN